MMCPTCKWKRCRCQEATRAEDYELGWEYMTDLVAQGGLALAFDHHWRDARASVGINPWYLAYVIAESDALMLMASGAVGV